MISPPKEFSDINNIERGKHGRKLEIFPKSYNLDGDAGGAVQASFQRMYKKTPPAVAPKPYSSGSDGLKSLNIQYEEVSHVATCSVPRNIKRYNNFEYIGLEDNMCESMDSMYEKENKNEDQGPSFTISSPTSSSGIYSDNEENRLLDNHGIDSAYMEGYDANEKIANDENDTRHKLQEEDCKRNSPDNDLYRRIWARKQSITTTFGEDDHILDPACWKVPSQILTGMVLMSGIILKESETNCWIN